MKTKIYMDYNATCPIRPAVIDVVAGAMATVGNPSSVHSAGRAAKTVMDEARTKVAALAGCRPRDVVFCSGGTEANNLVVRGCGAASLIISETEHPSVLASAEAAGLPVYKVGVDSNGLVDLASLRQLLQEAPAPALVSVMFANNETGVMQPVSEVAVLAKEFGAKFHTDAIQCAGKTPIDLTAIGADYLTLSSHKIGGPQGVGAVVMTPTTSLKALTVGGGQELGRRSGTENVAGVAGFGVAAFDALVAVGNTHGIQAMRDHLEKSIKALSSSVVIAGENTERLPNTSCIAMPNVKGETQVMHFDLAGICLSSGSACSSGKVKQSHVLTAMGYDESVAESSIRVSLGYQTQQSDIDAFIKAWQALYVRTSSKGAA